MHTMRALNSIPDVGAIFYGVVSSILRRKRILALTGMLLASRQRRWEDQGVQINETCAVALQSA